MDNLTSGGLNGSSPPAILILLGPGGVSGFASLAHLYWGNSNSRLAVARLGTMIPNLLAGLGET